MKKVNLIVYGLACVSLGFLLGMKGRVALGFAKDAFGKGSINKIIEEISKEQENNRL